jgi:hypothetical protein
MLAAAMVTRHSHGLKKATGLSEKETDGFEAKPEQLTRHQIGAAMCKNAAVAFTVPHVGSVDHCEFALRQVSKQTGLMDGGYVESPNDGSWPVG